MLFQVVHCHPLVDSSNHALFQTIVAALEGAGHEVAPKARSRSAAASTATPAETQRT